MGEIASSWWMLLVRGLAAIVFGFLALIWPGITLIVLVAFFAAYFLVSGVFALLSGFRHGARSRAWLIISGIVGILAGIVAFAWPGITSIALLYVVAFWAIVSGVAEVVAGIQLRKDIDNEWMLIVGGILSVIFGVLLLIWPGAGLLSLVWLVGAFAILYGISEIALALRVKNFTSSPRVP
ncbi:HdeD family acid-resistance protein [Nonomuraea diastatica]|uniref:HdeD family acid-resistance protein n=1 Tax=Nonomuraea diastatica TaxID=1848329 RepID=A0A4R4VPV2_9ACTN|nr:HdeD family acid-resistance protein [Nonomuraea diastatica]TDD07782.1 HdeD family acid-resistance protein [Nonomuraea diastatica]